MYKFCYNTINREAYMPQFTFTCVDEEDTTTTMEFEGIFLPHVVDKVEGFLKASGFYFDELQVVNNFADEDDEEIKIGLTASDDDIPGDPSY